MLHGVDPVPGEGDLQAAAAGVMFSDLALKFLTVQLIMVALGNLPAKGVLFVSNGACAGELRLQATLDPERHSVRAATVVRMRSRTRRDPPLRCRRVVRLLRVSRQAPVP